MLSPRALLERAGLRPKKRYGQNFLQNVPAARKIARLSLVDAVPGLRTLEIGAGTGVLTRALLEAGATLTALEIDPDLIGVLRARDDLETATILQADALTFDYRAWSDGRPWHIAGNLPYNVGTAILLQLIEMENGPSSLTVMVQKDVADRITAAPATPQYGSLSVAVRFAMRAQNGFTLAPASFFPAPRVQSRVIRLVRRREPAVRPCDATVFWKVVRGAFAYRRKTLANSLALALGLKRDRISRALQSINLSPELRGERLDLGDFARLADALAEE